MIRRCWLLLAIFMSCALCARALEPLRAHQWYLDKIRLDEALVISKNLSRNLSEVVVAIIDTGVDWSHEDLREIMWRNNDEIADNGIDDDNNGFIDDIRGWDFYDNDNDPHDVDDFGTGHGTMCAGIIGASTNNQLGIQGIAPMVKIMPIRAYAPMGTSTMSILAAAVDYAVNNGAHIINASWGGYATTQAAKLCSNAISKAHAAGVIFVNAAGNEGLSNDENPGFPGSLGFNNIISVAASDENDQKWHGSNFGLRSVDIAAPGVNIMTTLMGNRYGPVDATSVAAPIISGVVALMKSIDPALDALRIKNILQSTGFKMPVESACNCRVDVYNIMNILLDKSNKYN